MAEVVRDFRDEQGRPRKPTSAESAAIARYLNDQNPIDTSIPVRLGGKEIMPSTMAEASPKEEIQPGDPARLADQSGMYDTIRTGLDEMLASQKREQGIHQAYAPRLEELRKAEEAEILRQQATRPQPPQPQQRPDVPTRGQYIDPTAGKSLFAVASLMAGLAMAGGRGRGMLAMSGLTGAMQGWNEGNHERYEAGLKEYKLQVDNQIDAYNEQYKTYMGIIQSNKLSLDEKIRMYDLEAARQQDELGLEAARRKDVSEMIKHATEIQKLAVEAQKARAVADELPSKQKFEREMRELKLATARANLEKSKQQKEQKAQTNKDIEHLRMAIATQQRTLEQQMKEAKAAHGMFDWAFGNKPLKTVETSIKSTKANIAKMQDQLNQLVLGQKVSEAVGSKDDFEVGEPLQLP